VACVRGGPLIMRAAFETWASVAARQVQEPARVVDPSAPAGYRQASFGCILKERVDILD
jgi:hypothetical protein